MKNKDKKIPIMTIKKIKKSDKTLTRVDQNTFYVKSSDPNTDPYMIYNSKNIGWCCDCMSFVMNMEGSGAKEQFECKHIRMCKNYG